MKVLNAFQQKELDQLTIAKEPISSIDLMERACNAFCKSFKLRYDEQRPIHVFCGPGNNGGDGLGIARLLFEDGFDIQVFRIESENYSLDNVTNMERLVDFLPKDAVASQIELLPKDKNPIAIDALFGTGLSRPIAEKYEEIVAHINSNYKDTISVDLPSGLFSDKPNKQDDPIVVCSHCISFHSPKLAFLLPSSGKYVESWEVVDIRIPKQLSESFPSPHIFVDTKLANSLEQKTSKFSHKGSFGFGLLWAGSYGMFGAAILASKAAMRAGIGKLTIYSSNKGHDILQIANPEVMFANEDQLYIPNSFNAIGLGPGLGNNEKFSAYFQSLAETYQNIPWVLDADALNQLSQSRELLEKLPKNSILTPHQKEFERLSGQQAADSFERLEQLKSFAKKTKCIVVLKGAHSAIACPNGNVYFNSTGNSGMSTAGSGDVLTGVILALLAQGFTSLNAAIYGVYLHGEAGDKANLKRSSRSIIASDIINEL